MQRAIGVMTMILNHTATFARVSTGDSLELSLKRRLILIRADLAGRLNEALALARRLFFRCLHHVHITPKASILYLL